MQTARNIDRLDGIVAAATGWVLPPVTRTCPAPNAGGAYALVLWLDRPVRLRGNWGTLHRAGYVYAGSAYGPGGLAARMGRHLGTPRAIHWHIDQLTGLATAKHGFAHPGGNECAIVNRLLETGEFDQPIAGFGATDCSACASHLLRWVG